MQERKATPLRFWQTLKRDFHRNGADLAPSTFVRSLVVPNRFGALTWLRLYQRFEDRTIARALAYRVLLHVHGLEMDREVEIGPGLYLPHPRGVLFASGTRLGRNVAVYGMVRFLATERGVPEVEDGVFLGDGARVLGRVVIGEESQVGAGAIVTKDLPKGVSAAGVPARVIRELGGSRPSFPRGYDGREEGITT